MALTSCCPLAHSMAPPTQQCTRIPIHQHSRHLLFSVCCIIAVPAGVKRHVPVALACISLIPGDADHPSMCFMGHCVSSLEKCLLFAMMLCLCSCVKVLYVLWIQDLYKIYYLPIFYTIFGSSLYSFEIALSFTKGFHFDKVQFFCFFCLLYNCHSLKYHIKGMILSNPRVWDLSLCFLPRCFHFRS